MNKRIVIWSAVGVVAAGVLGFLYMPRCVPVPASPAPGANTDVFLLLSDKPELRSEVFANVTEEYRRSSEAIASLLPVAIEKHRHDRTYNSPLVMAISTASYLHVFQVEDALLTAVDYELDVSTIPLGAVIDGSSLIPAARALVDLRVNSKKVLDRIEISKSEKETKRLCWVLYERLGSLEQAWELVKEKRVARSNQIIDGYLKAEELLAGVKEGHELLTFH